MPDDAGLPPRRLTDPRAMRALAHPSRLALWELLAVHGPMTATQAAEHVADSPSNCSFHLRQLARYGFVEETGESTGRSRPWRVTQLGYTTAVDPRDASTELAAETLGDLALDRALDRHRRWRRTRQATPPAWRTVGGANETVWWATPEEVAALEAEVEALVYRFRERLGDPDRRPEGARAVEFVALVHPFDDLAEQAGDR